VLQSEIATNSLNAPMLGFKVVQGHRCLVPLESFSAVLVMINCKSVLISKNRQFGSFRTKVWKPPFQFSKSEVGSIVRKPKTEIFIRFRTAL